MSADPRAVVAVLAIALVASSADAAQPAPGVKRVCVPAEDGRTWECGTADDPPPQRPVAPRDSPPPPAFLAAPGSPQITPIEEAPAPEPEPIAERPRTDDFPDAPEREDEAASTDEVAASDAPVDEPAPEATLEPEPVAESEPTPAEAAPTSSPPPFIASPRRRGYALGPPLAPDSPPEPASVAESEAPAEAPAETPSEPVSSVEAEPIAETPVEPGPATESEPSAEPAPLYTGAPPLDADAFLALDGAGYTVQLAHAPTPDGFPALLAELDIDPSTAYALPTPRNGAPWWTLAWSSFPDAAAARGALATLPRSTGINVGYPRRIALIQNTLRR